jgi:hypothetical protein
MSAAAFLLILAAIANKNRARADRAGPQGRPNRLRYVWNLKVPLTLSGMENEKVLLENIGYARAFTPDGHEKIAAVLEKVKETAGDGRLERFKSTQDFDSTVHKKQHNLG